MLADKEKNILPLLIDLTNPSSGIGWGNTERMSIFDRGPCDTVLALALIHHLAISNNIPFIEIAGCFAQICNMLIIEFVAKDDSQVEKMLSSRKDIFTRYTKECFEADFGTYFTIVDSVEIIDSKRIIYLMQRS